MVELGSGLTAPEARKDLTSVPACRDARRAETYEGYFDFNQLDIYAHVIFLYHSVLAVCLSYF